ncbi:tRNA pseudouridine(55) synthase TruB [Paenibacillus sp. GCM10023252]|uniref:tRNA pseudouridine(55) synthase TruB n=1 Tax=Paenibacillus sp. GCM10023252 TaxID=3252649 RepID=UPI003607DC2C
MDGILAVWKPAGWTSHDVVAKVRGILRTKRIGHAGTLDPMVTGVLPLCIGRSTRVVEYLQDRPKAYRAVLQFGVATDTEDTTGNIIEEAAQVTLTEEDIHQALRSFVGEIDQVPPMFSAVKVDGKRLYELAREGVTVERKSRRVTIYEIELLDMQLNQPRPTITFTAVCSKGTYIRTLCVDIGKALGVPSAMAGLTRTMSGGFTEKDCLTLEQIAELAAAREMESKLLPADSALSHLKRVEINEGLEKAALQGQKLPYDRIHTDVLGRVQAEAEAEVQAEAQSEAHDNNLVTVYNESGRFIGIYEQDADSSVLRPVKVFAGQSS